MVLSGGERALFVGVFTCNGVGRQWLWADRTGLCIDALAKNLIKSPVFFLNCQVKRNTRLKKTSKGDFQFKHLRGLKFSL